MFSSHLALKDINMINWLTKGSPLISFLAGKGMKLSLMTILKLL